MAAGEQQHACGGGALPGRAAMAGRLRRLGGGEGAAGTEGALSES